MTRSRRPLLLLFALALLLAAGLGAWQGRAARDQATAAEAPDAAAIEAASDAASDAAPALPEAFTEAPPVPDLPGLPPLPPASMRLGEAWPVLEARALAGDWRAGCRLADALAACERGQVMRQAVALLDGRELPPLDCADVPASLLERRALFRLAAAQAGHRASAEAFVHGIDLPALDSLSPGIEPALAAYRQHYHALRLRLLEQGSLLAAASSLSDFIDTDGEGLSRDDEIALREFLMAARILDDQRVQSVMTMTERSGEWLSRVDPDEAQRLTPPEDAPDDAMTPIERWSALRGAGLGDASCEDAQR